MGDEKFEHEHMSHQPAISCRGFERRDVLCIWVYGVSKVVKKMRGVGG